MSFKHLSMALETKTGSSTKKIILVKLAEICNDEGICWPSMKTVADHCELKRETVSRNLKLLEESGLISIKNRFREDGSKTSNCYQLNLRQSHNPCDLKSHAPCDAESQQEPVIYEPVIDNKKINKKDDPRIKEILDYLNQRAGKNFRNPGDVNARLKEGYELEDFLKVIDNKIFHWFNDPKMKAFLRPSTLFCKKNFDAYVNEDDLLKTPAPEEKAYEL